MTKRPYSDAERAEIGKLLEAAEPLRKAQQERIEAIRKARRDIFQLREVGILPSDDAA